MSPAKRPARKIVTAEIYVENAEKIREKAEKEGKNIKETINAIIEEHFKKTEFMKQILPSLSIDSIQDNLVILKDMETRKLVGVLFKDNDLHCETDVTNNCVHTRFVWMSFEVANLVERVNKNIK